jgi:hypothetical protein
MRTMILTAMAALLPVMAHAADTPVQLEAGQDYMLAVDGQELGGAVGVRGPGGRTAATVRAGPYTSG